MTGARRSLRLLPLVAALLLAWHREGHAEAVPVDLKLVLAIDVSESIDATEARLQREGYIAAFRDPEVLKAIQSGALRRIAITYFEWGESTHQKTLVDWTLLEDEASLHEVAQKLAEASYAPARWTSISGAIDFAVARLAENNFSAGRRAIDISGDGSNNHGRDVVQARDEAIAKGVTINGLPIVGDRLSRYGWPRSADVDYYYEHTVIGGPGAFIVVADGMHAFAAAILRKLVKEIAEAPSPRLVQIADASLSE